MTDGTAMAFTRYSTEGPGNSLYFVEGAEAFPAGVVVGSERLDADEGRREVPDRHLLHADRESGVTLRPLYPSVPGYERSPSARSIHRGTAARKAPA